MSDTNRPPAAAEAMSDTHRPPTAAEALEEASERLKRQAQEHRAAAAEHAALAARLDAAAMDVWHQGYELGRRYPAPADTDWKQLAQALCAHIEMVLDGDADEEGYRTVGPSWAAGVGELVEAVIAAAGPVVTCSGCGGLNGAHRGGCLLEAKVDSP